MTITFLIALYMPLLIGQYAMKMGITVMSIPLIYLVHNKSSTKQLLVGDCIRRSEFEMLLQKQRLLQILMKLLCNLEFAQVYFKG